jgi:glutathione S-transferase
MLTVHHLNNSRSQRILWLLEEIGVDYEITKYQRNPDTMLAPKALRDIHPLGKSPAITDGGRTIAESGAIIEYIVDTYCEDRSEGRLRPDRGTPEFERYRYWMHYAEGSAMTPLLLKLIFNRLPSQVPWLLRPVLNLVSKGVKREFINPEIARHMGYWEKELAERTFFVTDTLTAADIQMIFPLEAAVARGKSADAYPRINGFVDTCHARPAYQRALERGGAYSLGM